MKSKNKITFLTLALSLAMILSACNSTSSSPAPSESSSSASSSITSEPSSAPSSSSQSQAPTSQSSSSAIPSSSSSASVPSSSSIPSSSSSSASSSSIPSTSSQVVEQKYTVTFKAGEDIIYTVEVKEGELAAYEGEDPVKAGDANASKYRFVGWDRDLTQPITADTVINAVFEAYYDNAEIDNFEDYEDTASMIDEGWVALAYSNSGWTDETKAAVSLSTNAADGEKALRLDAWQNGMGYKADKIFQEQEFTQPANALAFKIMAPQTVTIKVLLHAAITIAGKPQAPSFTFTIGKPISSDYVDYIIPLADDGWALWGEAGKSIKAVADWSGVAEEDILSYLTKIEFYFEGNDNAGGQPYTAFIDTVNFVTLDEPAYVKQDYVTLGNLYTATLPSNNILRVDIDDNGSATASVIDLPTPQTISGNVTLEDRLVTFTSADNGQTLTYKGKITNSGQLIKFDSATGAFASNVEDVNLTAVQVVDNYEQYEKDGVSYYQSQKDKNARSGCRGAYYSEYYAGSGRSDWGGDGWQIMGGDGSQLKLKQDPSGAHSGNNYLCLKHSKDKAMRYMQWGLFDGTSEQNAFRGNKFSFWARSNGYVQKFKFYMYSQSAPTNATRDERVKSYEFVEDAAISEWKHYEIDLNPNFVYYGFSILIEKNTSLSANEAYLYIDDVEVYAGNPYAKYTPPETKKLPTNVNYIGKIGGLYQVQAIIKSATEVYLIAPGLTNSLFTGTYTFDETEVVMTFTDDTYTALVSEDMKTFTFKSVTGTGSIAQYLNGVDFIMIDYADEAEQYKSDGLMYYQSSAAASRSGARGAYYCEYYQGGDSYSTQVGGQKWSLMGGTGDQLQLGTGDAFVGQKYLKMKKSTAGAMRYMQWGLYDGTAEAHTGVSKLNIGLKNPLDTETKITVSVYKVQKVTTETNTEENRVDKVITLPANQSWLSYTIDLDPTETYYGYAVLAEKASKTGYFGVDCVYYYNVDSNPSNNFYTKKDLVLRGNIVAGEASIKFDNLGKFYFTCANLGANNLEGAYDMYMESVGTQIMVLSIQGTTIKGTYYVDATGVATFTVTEVTGAMASAIEVGTFLTNQ